MNRITDSRRDQLFDSCGIHHMGREFGTRICTFAVSIRDGEKAWMKMHLHPESDKWVVIVRKRQFLDAWARSGQEHHLATGDESVWRQDYKFLHAEKGFSDGISNPVSLAWCGANYITEKGLPALSVGFTDGITRTIWLLANGAEHFPVSVFSETCARLLYRGAGARNTEPLSVSYLLQNFEEPYHRDLS
ncbi:MULTISPECIES: plasmid fertility inhibition factor family protein [Enterobacterales]|uniref:plasmid fertility inhibition factor family protein n=1 Tax=Enterobacterales TaxID=91347 RepID=UPI001E488847|nr:MULTISPECIES: hypothetical protein [Enterobacterales]